MANYDPFSDLEGWLNAMNAHEQEEVDKWREENEKERGWGDPSKGYYNKDGEWIEL